MKKQLVIIGLIALLASVSLSGCNQGDRTLSPEESRFVGTWRTDDENARADLGERLMFLSDGTVTFRSDFTGTFKVDAGNYLFVQITKNGTQTQYQFDYEISTNRTTLTLLYFNTGRMYVYTRE